jgi:hypothetical protein
MTAYGARAGPAGTIWRCLLIGEDRKWPVGGQNGAFDPSRKWPTRHDFGFVACVPTTRPVTSNPQ